MNTNERSADIIRPVPDSSLIQNFVQIQPPPASAKIFSAKKGPTVAGLENTRPRSFIIAAPIARQEHIDPA
jgi:hypothetical protein